MITPLAQTSEKARISIHPVQHLMDQNFSSPRGSKSTANGRHYTQVLNLSLQFLLGFQVLLHFPLLQHFKILESQNSKRGPLLRCIFWLPLLYVAIYQPLSIEYLRTRASSSSVLCQHGMASKGAGSIFIVCFTTTYYSPLDYTA